MYSSGVWDQRRNSQGAGIRRALLRRDCLLLLIQLFDILFVVLKTLVPGYRLKKLWERKSVLTL